MPALVATWMPGFVLLRKGKMQDFIVHSEEEPPPAVLPASTPPAHMYEDVCDVLKCWTGMFGDLRSEGSCERKGDSEGQSKGQIQQ